MGEAIEISPERIRRFALDGGLSEAAATHFLDNQCHMLIMRNLAAVVAQEVLPDIMSVGLVVSVDLNESEGTLMLTAWVPFDHGKPVMDRIREAYQANGLTCPYEHYDLDNMDSAMVGRDYIRAMLTGYAQEHGELP